MATDINSQKEPNKESKKSSMTSVYVLFAALIVAVVVYFFYFDKDDASESLKRADVPKTEMVYKEKEKPAQKEQIAKMPSLEYIQYTTKKEDILSLISKERYASRYFWPFIYALNKDIIKDQDVIHQGMVLKIPKAIDMSIEENVVLVTESFLDAYDNYRSAKKRKKSLWLLYACYKNINPKVLDDYKERIDAADIEMVRSYIARFSK